MSKFLKFIVNVFLVFAILVACAILLPTMFGVTTTIVDSASMDTNLPYGSITYSHSVDAAELKAGDEILRDDDASTYAYIIKNMDAGQAKASVANATDENGETQEISLHGSVSKVAVMIPYIGYVLIAMHSTQGVIIIALVVVLMVILFILSELWKEKPEDMKSEEEEEGEGTEDNPATQPLNMELPPIEGAAEIVVPEPETGDEYEEEPAPAEAVSAESPESTSEEPMTEDEPVHSGMTLTIPDVAVEEDADMSLRVSEDETISEEGESSNIIDKDLQGASEEGVEENPVVDVDAESAGEKSDDEAAVHEELVLSADSAQEAYGEVPGETSEEVLEEASVEIPEETQEDDTAAGPIDSAEEAEEVPVVEEAEPVSEPETSWTEAPEPETSETSGPEMREPNPFLNEEAVVEEPETEQFTPVNRGTLEEILDQASGDNMKPEVVEDEATGITLVDYSRVI